LFRAKEKPVDAYPCPDRGWGALADGGVEIHEAPGNHLTMLEEPHVAALAMVLRHCLDAAGRPAARDHG
jgi:oxalate---CoA ligase